ncbi:MAG: AAA family ATPase [Bacteroidales bacterium]|nr:AAA family ATPase [Bacteroidales bacterium]
MNIGDYNELVSGLNKSEYNKVVIEEYDDTNVICAKPLISFPLQQIFYGAPGTGKSHRIKEIIKEHGIDEKKQVIRTTFHPDSDYSTFVGCYKPIMKKVPQTYVVEGNEKPVMADKDNQATKDEIVYDYTPQAFVQAYTKAWTNPGKPVILVIEEINRGNCAQIFGDIFQLLDRGDDGVSEYEIKPDKALENYLRDYFAAIEDVEIPEQIKIGEIMKLPANLYIWATMNTSDQSLFPIDSAFKRRWEWKYLPINNHEDKNYKIKVGGTKYDWWGFLSKINEVIGNTTSSEDKKLGYFFAKANENGIVTAEQFVGKVLFYLWNDVFKNYGFDNQIFDKGDKKKFDFSDFFKQDGSPDTDMVNKFLGKLDETIDKENTFVEKPIDDKGQEEPSDTEA